MKKSFKIIATVLAYCSVTLSIFSAISAYRNGNSDVLSANVGAAIWAFNYLLLL
jgi:hypothetical protein